MKILVLWPKPLKANESQWFQLWPDHLNIWFRNPISKTCIKKSLPGGATTNGKIMRSLLVPLHAISVKVDIHSWKSQLSHVCMHSCWLVRWIAAKVAKQQPETVSIVEWKQYVQVVLYWPTRALKVLLLLLSDTRINGNEFCFLELINKQFKWLCARTCFFWRIKIN